MKITGQNILKSLDFVPQADVNERIHEKRKQKEVPRMPADDNINISPGAVEFSKIKKLVNAVPEIREDKLKGISDQLRSGEYKVPPELIASKLISENILNTPYED